MKNLAFIEVLYHKKVYCQEILNRQNKFVNITKCEHVKKKKFTDYWNIIKISY